MDETFVRRCGSRETVQRRIGGRMKETRRFCPVCNLILGRRENNVYGMHRDCASKHSLRLFDMLTQQEQIGLAKVVYRLQFASERRTQ
jgi:hypothetical protein